MSSQDDDLWRKMKAGRLDEGEGEAHLLTGGKASIGRFVRIGTSPAITRRSVPYSKIEHRLGALPWKGAHATPFHFEYEHLTRRPPPTLPRGALNGQRVAVYPSALERSIVAGIRGARYHRDHRVWTLPKNHPILGTAAGDHLTSPLAHAAAFDGRSVTTRADTLRTAIWHVEYATRSGELEDRSDEVACDDAGAIIEGTMGRTPEERREFWKALDVADDRENARLQERLVAELPFTLSLQDCRKVLRRFGSVFDAHGIAWVGAVHLPDPGGDDRNLHLHIVLCPRPVVSWDINPGDDGQAVVGAARPCFARKKNRSAQGSAWIAELRQTYADIVNDISIDAALTSKKELLRFFHPGSAAELAMEARDPAPKRDARIRRGRGTENENGTVAEARAVGPREFVRRLRQTLNGIDADRTAFLTLCDYLKTPRRQPPLTREVDAARQVLIDATDAAADAIERAAIQFDEILGEPPHERRTKMLDDLLDRARDARDRVAEAFEASAEYSRQINFARRSALADQARREEEARRMAAAFETPDIPLVAPSRHPTSDPRLRPSNGLADRRNQGPDPVGTDDTGPLLVLIPDGDHQPALPSASMGPYILAVFAADMQHPVLFERLRESVRRAEMASLQTDLDRLEVDSRRENIGDLFIRARSALAEAMRSDLQRRSAAEAAERAERAERERVAALTAGPFPNQDFVVRVADSPRFGTKAADLRPALERLPTERLERLYAHTRASHEQMIAAFRRRGANNTQALEAAALRRGAALLEEVARARGLRLGTEQPGRSPPASPKPRDTWNR